MLPGFLHTIVMRKDPFTAPEECYIFKYNHGDEQIILKAMKDYANNFSLSFTSMDAEILSRKVQENSVMP